MPAANQGEKIVVEYFIRKTDDPEHKKTTALIHLPKRGWRWRTRLALFEPLHGMSRAVRLIPDKIATSEAIADEAAQNPRARNDSPAFLIDLVKDLVLLFKNLAAEKAIGEHELPEFQSLPVSICGSEHVGFDELDFDPAESLDFSAVLANFWQLLDDLAVAFQNRQPHEEIATQLLDMGDGIVAATETFIKYIHPAILSAQRNCRPADPPSEHEFYLIGAFTPVIKARVAAFANRFISDEYRQIKAAEEDDYLRDL
jgi:hypothetical protein